jgi:hypothetical protein
MTYADFLARKQRQVQPAGRAIDVADVHPMLHPWQKQIVVWAVRVGRAAIWADTGTGKTVMQLQWAALSGKRALIVAPLAVCHQTVREAVKVELEARYVRSGADVDGPGIWVTNYEMVQHFDPSAFDAVVLDESSILKQADGKTRTMLIQHFRDVPHRLSCSATPAPNDNEELTSQAEFLGVMPRVEMLAAYFVHDDEGWRIKGHARSPMFRWMATWAVAIRRPSDIGGDDTGYILPGYEIIPHLLPVDATPDGQLFATDLGGVGGRAKIRKATLEARCKEAAGLVLSEPDEPWIVWCGRNDEQEYLERAFGDRCFSVTGTDTPEVKADRMLRWVARDRPILLTKPSIAGFGMNFQHCARMAFVGLSDSYEAYYQSIRRCYRYGQTRLVYVHIILSEIEGQIAENVARKEKQAAEMTDELVREMQAAGELRMTP